MSVTNNSLFDFLRSQDKRRLSIREDYKAVMNNTQPEFDNSMHVIFPAMHVQTEHAFLRNGLSWHYNGFLITTGKTVIVVDPGVDFLFRLQISGIDPSIITHVYISHAHIDHYGGANSIMDWLIRAKKPVTVLAPESVFTNKSVSDFHSGRMEFPAHWKPLHSSISIKPNSKIQLDDCTLLPFDLYHSIECMGFRLETPHGQFSYISDTGYAITMEDKGKVINIKKGELPKSKSFEHTDWHKDIDNHVAGSDLMVANIDSFYPNKNSTTHMSLLDLVFLLSKSNNIKKVILGHVNPIGELAYDEWGEKLAQYVEAESSIKCYSVPNAGISVTVPQ